MAVYMVRTKEIHVVGKGWYGQTMAYTYTLSGYDLENIGDYRDRDKVQSWLDTHAGDFQSFQDFRTDIDDFDSEWSTEEGEMLFNDCMFGEEEE